MPRITLSARRGAANQRVGVAGVVVVVVATVVVDIVEVGRIAEVRRTQPPPPSQQPTDNIQNLTFVELWEILVPFLVVFQHSPDQYHFSIDHFHPVFQGVRLDAEQFLRYFKL